VEGFTEDHFHAFEFYGIEKVLIAYDRDEAGDRAAENYVNLPGRPNAHRAACLILSPQTSPFPF
jgi:hypothetical protein